MSHVYFSHDDVRKRLKEDYEKRIEVEKDKIDALVLDRSAIDVQESQWARRHLLLTEKSHTLDAYRQGILDQDIYEKLLADIDARLLRLESDDEEETTA